MKFPVYFLWSFILIFSSCSSFQKWRDGLMGRNKIVGPGAEDIEAGGVESVGSDSMAISGLSTVFFDLDSSVLSGETKRVLDSNMKWIKKRSNIVRMELEGHCDPLGSEAYNIGLGERRATAVKQYLMARGVSASKIEIISYGEERPLSQTDNAKNRRVNFVPIY